jgi:D-lactate dehydrogenase (cytochrome)
VKTVATLSSGPKTSYSTKLAVAVVVSAAIGGALGYLSSTRKSKLIKGTSSTTTYGSHGDLQYTILELKAELGADKVSTDPEVLRAHGVSPLGYPESAFMRLFCLTTCTK